MARADDNSILPVIDPKNAMRLLLHASGLHQCFDYSVVMNRDIESNKMYPKLTPLWSAKVAAEYLEMPEAKFRYYVFTRRIPYYRIGGVFRGGVIRFNPDDVRQWRQLREAGKEEWIEMAKAIDSSKDKMMTIKELAEFLSISRYTIYNWTSTRSLPFYKVGRAVRFGRKDIEAWLEAQKVEQFKLKEAPWLKTRR
jgi:excisionase family DNA binding protein